MRSFSLTMAAVAMVCVLVPAPSAAQVQRGSIYGTAQDRTGAVLPGVVVQLTSDLTAPLETVTGSRGEYRFRDLDPGQYTLRATLPAFAPLVREQIVVGVGGNVEIGIEMALAAVSEQVVVLAATPLLDVRRQGNVTNFDQATLNGIPTARDPWALMQHLPGVSIARPNVGGSESATQAQFAARGDNGSNTMWNIDGVTITDMTAVGASTTYYDFNVFEEVQFTTGSLDARQQTGGLAINLVSKRGTNSWRAAGRTYFSADDLQGENISSELKAAGLSGNRIRQFAEYGGDAGGPLRRDRLWIWAATAKTDVRQLAINGFLDNSVVNTMVARGDAQVTTATRFSFLYHRAEKLKNGRGAGVDRPPETTWNQSGPTNIYKAEASRVFGPALFLSAKYAFVDAGFALTPQSGLNGQAYFDFAAQVWHGSQTYSSSKRAQHQMQLDGSWARGRHDVKFGFQHRRGSSRETGGWPGNGTWTRINVESQGLPPGVGFAILTRPSTIVAAAGTTSLYAGDVMALGRWTVDLGIRFDRQRGRNRASRAEANGLAPSILPVLDYGGGPNISWSDLSPRIGTTYRVSDNTIARASYARFASQLGWGVVTSNNAAQPAFIEYLFRDANGDYLAQLSELLNPTGFVRGVNPADPSAPYSPNQVDEQLTAPGTQVFVGGVERELMPNFSMGVNVGHGYLANPIWLPFIGLSRDDFVEYRTAGTGSVASNTPVYRLAPGKSLPPGNGRVTTNRAGYHQRYWNVDFVGTKRLANRWMLRGFFTMQQQREYFDDPARSIQDPTPRFDFAPPLASGFIDGGLAANVQAFSEFIVSAKSIYSVAGMYELPGDISVAGTIYGRQGYPTAQIVSITRPGSLGQTGVLMNPDLDESRYPSLHLLDLRLQKKLRYRRSQATLNLDVFNLLNSAVNLRQVRDAAALSFRNPLEVVAPRLVRLGVQIQF